MTRHVPNDGVTQWTLGVFLGTFCYCLAVLPSLRFESDPFAPTAAVLGALLLALACVGWLLFFIHRFSAPSASIIWSTGSRATRRR